MRKSGCFLRPEDGKTSHNEHVELKHSLKHCRFMDVPESKVQQQ